LSSARIAGLNKIMSAMGVGPKAGPLTEKFMLQTYWPSMALYTLLVFPMIMQVAMRLAGMGGGDDDDDEGTWFTWNNEPGKEFHFDITPLANRILWDGAQSGKRRVYMRYGKQVWEVFDPDRGWLADTPGTAMGKLSSPVRTVIEQVSGRRVGGTDWKLPFAEENFFLSWVSGPEGFRDSRTAHVAGSLLLPYSAKALADENERKKFPFNVVGSVSQGMAPRALNHEFAKILKTYAEAHEGSPLSTKASSRAALGGLAVNVLVAAARNGYPIEEVIRNGQVSVLGDLYKEFFRALDKQDRKEMDKIARSILRVQGTVKGLAQSLKTQNRQNRLPGNEKVYAPEQIEAIRSSFIAATEAGVWASSP